MRYKNKFNFKGGFKMDKTILYDLDIFTEVEFWMGGYGLLHARAKNINEEVFKKIKKDPLRDYISHGVRKVTYARILVWKKQKIYNKKNQEITISDVDYSDEIESGELKGEYSDEFIREEMENYQTISISDVV